MLLQQIVETLDLELDRLYRLREIVSGLSQSTVLRDLSASLAASNAAADLPVEPVGPSRTTGQSPKVSRRAASRRQTRTKPDPAPAQKLALAGVIPNAPVVVSAATVAKEHAAKELARAQLKIVKPEADPGTLGSMIRALGLDRTA
ncbi:MAG TPA: hypothetical protein VKV02_04725 [Acidobacteriaceae bacterium]|nr:hypothetical protein [Acidobacteriaceae bacterium]